ncbi:MAG: bifunctional hydroxymethylpyrimidine kinase/phosphomethylpyrimidine kinase [Mailhella sp.]|nr:bifunctional hydroxymethylpyrimidine kinase/phosphomethylpyrimidine kinase [Mailhella sp.]
MDFQEALTRLADGRVLVIGDVMIDRNVFGDAHRISPEAPVPVVLHEATRDSLGGAGNVAAGVSALGARACLIGAVGTDRDADIARRLLAEKGIAAYLIGDPCRPTTVKERVFVRNQQILRLDRESSAPASEELRSAFREAMREALPGFSCVVLSDYNKGTVYPGIIEDIEAAARELGLGRPLILVDPKPANASCYSGPFMLTPNASETEAMTGFSVETQEGLLSAGRSLIRRFGASFVLTTLGARGMALFSADGRCLVADTRARQVYDVCGAGDTVIAVAAAALSAGVPVAESCAMANSAAGIAVGKLGTEAVSLSELSEADWLPMSPVGETVVSH